MSFPSGAIIPELATPPQRAVCCGQILWAGVMAEPSAIQKEPEGNSFCCPSSVSTILEDCRSIGSVPEFVRNNPSVALNLATTAVPLGIFCDPAIPPANALTTAPMIMTTTIINITPTTGETPSFLVSFRNCDGITGVPSFMFIMFFFSDS